MKSRIRITHCDFTEADGSPAESWMVEEWHESEGYADLLDSFKSEVEARAFAKTKGEDNPLMDYLD